MNDDDIGQFVIGDRYPAVDPCAEPPVGWSTEHRWTVEPITRTAIYNGVTGEYVEVTALTTCQSIGMDWHGMPIQCSKQSGHSDIHVHYNALGYTALEWPNP